MSLHGPVSNKQKLEASLPARPQQEKESIVNQNVTTATVAGISTLSTPATSPEQKISQILAALGVTNAKQVEPVRQSTPRELVSTFLLGVAPGTPAVAKSLELPAQTNCSPINRAGLKA